MAASNSRTSSAHDIAGPKRKLHTTGGTIEKYPVMAGLIGGLQGLFGGSGNREPQAQTPPAGADGEFKAELPPILPTAFDAATLHPMADLGKHQLEYLDLETNQRKADGLIASRGFLEDLSYGTGAMYLLGLGTGGFYGLVEGLRSTSSSMSPKLRTNAILNSVTRRGPYLGNLSGCLTLTYNFVAGGIDMLRGDYHDDAGSLAAGAITGALWNGSRGVRPMLISSGLLTGVTAGWCVLKRAVAPADDD